MCLPEFVLAALELPSLSGVYIVCLIVGGGLLVVSTVFGGDHDGAVDADVDLDIDMDLDVDLDVDGGIDGGLDLDGDMAADADGVDFGADHHGLLDISTWFSVRFLVYFAAVFGLFGTVLTYMTELTPMVVLVISLCTGLAIGQGVHQVIRSLKSSGGNSQVSIEDFLNQPARVTVAVKPPSRGEVGVRIGNREHYIPAVAHRSDDSFQAGEAVVIVEYSGGLAAILSRQEYEFTKNT